MKLSVVMTVLNGEPYVQEAIESVLGQSVSDFEFVIVDDASTDATGEILVAHASRDRRIRVIRNDRCLGLTRSVNLALAQARGDVIARQDADDISTADRFAVQLAAFDAFPDVALVTGAVEMFGPNVGRQTLLTHPSWQPLLEWELLFSNAIGAGAQVMFPRVLHGAPISFPEKYAYAQDYGLWCQLVRMGRVICPPAVVYRYRRHGTSISSTQKAAQDECVSRIRHEYQSHYVTTQTSADAAAEVTRFWQGNGELLPRDVPRVLDHLWSLRAGFLAAVDLRYGNSTRTRLERRIDEMLTERLGDWLYRSVKLRDVAACGRLLSIATTRRETLRVSARAVGRAANAILQKIWPMPRAESVPV